MNTAIKDPFAPDTTDVCTIVILYDGDATRARALGACDFLVNQFWQDVELKFHWWRTDFLSDTAMATVASTNAVASDFLIVCLESQSEIAPSLESWFESWLANRHAREGALVDLTSNTNAGEALTPLGIFLREISRRGNFDYFTSISEEEKNSTAAKRSTPDQTLKIDDILGKTRPPSHFGLNE